MSPLKLKLHRIHPNLRSVVYCSAMASGDEDEWEFGWSQFKKATLASEASKLMSALACTRKTQLLERCGSLNPVQRYQEHFSQQFVRCRSATHIGYV